MTARKGWFVAIAAFLVVGVLFLGVRPMQVPDEARYGIIPAAMVESGDWLSLRLAGFRFYEKPPLVYWLTAASISVFGEQPFAIRLPSALATLATALCAGWLAVRITGRRELGPLAFLVQATTVMPMVLGGVITLDPTFAATVALTMCAFFGACTSSGRERLGWLAAAGAAAGLSFLAKGLLALAIPGATALAYLAWQRRWRDMLVMPWIPLVAAVAAATPFVLAVERANPGMWTYFVMKEHVRRAVSPDLTQQPQPWWFYGAVFPAGALLWTLAWPNAAKGLRGAREWRDGVRFLLCWAVVPIMALSLSGGKLATYVLPMFAPVSVLVAMGLARGRESGAIARDVPARIGQALVWIAAGGCIVLAAAGTERFGVPTLWESGASVRFACLAAALVAWALADGWSWRTADGTRWLTRTAIAPIAVLAMVPFLYPTAALKAAKHPWPFLEKHRDALRVVDVLVVAGGSPALATSWTTGRRDLVIAGWADEFDNELNLAEELPRRIGWEEVAERALEARTSNPPRTFAVLCTTEVVERMLESNGLPPPSEQDADRDLTVLYWR